MKNVELYRLLEIPDEVKERLADYETAGTLRIPDALTDKILTRSKWEEGIKELQGMLSEDPDGIKILWELLNVVCNYSYEEYKKRGIPEDIFAATMKFCTRFLKERYQTYHAYLFDQAWWFPRQISLNEYRIGALEYEFVDAQPKEIAIHIPSDADLRKESISQSLEAFYQFRKTYYPDWENVLLTCHTWMLMPQLKELLGANSNIVAFQNLFEIDAIDYDATWYMQWIFPGVKNIDEFHAETSTLQRNLKKYLSEGKKFGVAKGHLKQNGDPECAAE